MKEIDPVEELHKIRQAICKEAGGTPAAYARYYFELSQERIAAKKPAPAGSKHLKPSVKPDAKASVRKAGKRRKTVAT